MGQRISLWAALLGGSFACFSCSVANDSEETVATTNQALSGSPEFYTPRPDHGAIVQFADLTSAGDATDAALIKAMVNTPQAVGWFIGGTPKSVMHDAKNAMARARNQGVPILVAYNIPYRDCMQYSTGGAPTTEEYEAWIDGFAAGIGDETAIVILEPDSLGIIPFYTTLDGNMEWCQPIDEEGNPQPGASPSDRFAQLTYAVNSIRTAAPNALVYLDATHSNWLGVGEVTSRLLQAGIENASGFFLNVSNFQYTANSIQYGSWISRCIASYPNMDDNHCANKWWNGGPATGWAGDAMSPFGEWTGGAAELALNTEGIDSRYEMVAGPEPTTHFVIDTSRNGQGPWQPPSGYDGNVAQDWCNPPGRGVGLPPTFETGNALVDAYVWAKTPGQSDGECTRWGEADAGVDPVRNMQDPAPGIWFPEFALELATNANPPLL